ncbi:MAG: hypothetical protein E3J96_06690 [Sulfurovum sp.]|nr:MAG: hypothetical protein E3J96_06690 [Sulfurovum sp.]
MMKIIMSMLLITSIVLASPIKEDRRSISITHSNDINVLGETSGVKTGDDLLTGILGISYRDSEAFYEMDLKSYTQRHIANGERVDTLSLGYLRDLVSGNHMGYGYEVIVGAQLIHSGDFGGEVLQNAIHALTGNPRYDLSFSDETHTTFGLQSRISGSYALNQNFNVYNNLAIKANIDKSGSGKLELGVEGAYESVSFWLGGVIQYIEPFKHTIVEFSTPDKYTGYAVFGASARFAKKYELMLETTFGGAPLGEKDDYSTQVRLRYFLD